MTQDEPEFRSREPKFRRRSSERPDEVLDAALELFSRDGFARTTVEAIAARAGLSKAAVYLYFPSKQALLKALVHRAIGQVADRMLPQVESWSGDPRPLISMALRSMGQVLAQPGVASVPALIMREAPHAPEIAALYREEVLDRAIPALTGLIARGVAGGHIRPVDPEMTVRSLVGPILAHVALAHVFGVQPQDGLAIDRLIDNHLTILNAGLAPGEAST